MEQAANPLQALSVFADAVSAKLLGWSGDSGNYLQWSNYLACYQAAVFYSENMLTASPQPNERALLDFALGLDRKPGLILEFGVATGRSVNHIASRAPQETIYGFDVFSGLPEDWRTGFPKGRFAQGLPAVAGNVELIVDCSRRRWKRFSRHTPATSPSCTSIAICIRRPRRYSNTLKTGSCRER